MKKPPVLVFAILTAFAVFMAVVLMATPSRVVAASPPQPLKGFADMHTHPLSNLGFGGMIVYGAPDIGSLLLSGQKYRGWHIGARNCNTENERVRSIEDALGFDNQMHGGPGFGTTSFGDANNCGDVIRTAIIDEVEKKYIHEFPNPGLAGAVNDHPHRGYPAFAHWPHWSSVTHQQMYWEWIKRSFDGGQRVMVALAVNNSLLAKAANANQFVDDKSSVDLQLDEIKRFVGRHADFMEVATTPAKLREIVQSNRMAVILGVETDDFGNLTRRANFARENITQSQVNAEIGRLFNLGVRYIIPIHFSNTVLGGYAINDDLFALSSKEYTNSFPVPVETCGEGIHFELNRSNFDFPQADLLRTRDIGRIIDTQPDYTPPRSGCGHKNGLSLTPLGRGAIQTMMNLGMMIDIDHMSRLAADETLGIAKDRNYPINSGHNGPLASDCISVPPGTSRDSLQHCTENQRTTAQYETIRSLRGMVGLGHGGKATNFVKTYRTVLETMGNRPVAIGTDANGLEALPKPDLEAPVRYDSSFPKYFFGREWDFNVVGFAHYGLFPDYIRSWQSSADPAARMTDRSMDAFMSSAEGFARMWEKSALRAVGAPRIAPLRLTTGWCTHAGAVVHTGDFNGDGANDLLCKDARAMSIDFADSRGALAGTTDLEIPTVWCTHSGITFFGTGDFNGDGRTDLMCKDPRRIWINTANSDGSFAPGGSGAQDTTWCTGPSATSRLADVNGDGRTDLMCSDARTRDIAYANASSRFSVP